MPARLLSALWVATLLALWAAPLKAAVDLDALWDYAQPARTEQRLREALATAQGDDVLVLRTQIARTHSLRRQFDAARRELDAIEPQLAQAGPAPQVHAALERGRTLRSSGQAAAAEPWFRRAFEQADRAGLERLAADALHMVALVQADPAQQIAWNRRVLGYARAAVDPQARRWEAVALNNMGVTLNDLGRHHEALAVLQDAQRAYERVGRPDNVRIARWMVAHTLRLAGRPDEALPMLRALESEWAEAGRPSPYVFDELAEVFAARGDVDRMAYYRALAKANR